MADKDSTPNVKPTSPVMLFRSKGGKFFKTKKDAAIDDTKKVLEPYRSFHTHQDKVTIDFNDLSPFEYEDIYKKRDGLRDLRALELEQKLKEKLNRID